MSERLEVSFACYYLVAKVMFLLQYPWDVIKKAHALGLLNGHIPEHCGEYISCNISCLSNYCLLCFQPMGSAI